MDVRASLRFLHMGPRKVRLVTNLLRGRPVREAEVQLRVSTKAAARPLLKLLQSAVANAKHNYNLEVDRLYIKQFLTDEGPKLRRWTPRAFGRAAPILKRMSHITIVLSEAAVETVRGTGSKTVLSRARIKPSVRSSIPKPQAAVAKSR